MRFLTTGVSRACLETLALATTIGLKGKISITREAWIWASSQPSWAYILAGGAVLIVVVLVSSLARSLKSASKRQDASQLLRPSEPRLSPISQASGPGESDDDARIVRVFISSTFVDMQEERNALVARTFPALRAKFRPRDIEVVEIDLRWGVTEEQVKDGKTIEACLAEIDRCQPFFIALLGQRYGSLFPAEHLAPELALAFPVLREAVGRSLTEIEIMHGVLNRPEVAKSAIFFVRDPAWLLELTESERLAFGWDAPERLTDLVARAKQAGVKFRSYARPGDIDAAVEAELSCLIEARYPEANADAFARDNRLHRHYARQRLGGEVGLEDNLAKLDRFAENSDGAGLLVAGETGAGKTTLLAAWARRRRAKVPSDLVLEHYLGADATSAEPGAIMTRLWRHLDQATGEGRPIPEARRELVAAFAQRLARASAIAEARGIKIIIVLDGLERLTGDVSLGFLPPHLGPAIRLLMSTGPGLAQAAAEARGWGVLELAPLALDDRAALIAARLARWGKAMNGARIETIVRQPQSGNPLFLKTLLDELRVSGIEADLNARLADYLKAPDLRALFEHVLARLERDCGPEMVGGALGLLACGREGLEEAELLAICGAPPLSWSMLRNSAGEALREANGRLVFDNELLQEAVEQRYLNEPQKRRATHKAIAQHFARLPADARQGEELPYQLLRSEDWAGLQAFLTDLERIGQIKHFGATELLGYWLALQAQGRDPETLLLAALQTRQGAPSSWDAAALERARLQLHFLTFAGFEGQSMRALAETCLSVAKRLFGAEAPQTLSAALNVAELIAAGGDIKTALGAYGELLSKQEAVHGKDHLETIAVVRKLAPLQCALGAFDEARASATRAFEATRAQRGDDDVNTWSCLEDLAQVELHDGELDAAREIQEAVIDRMLLRLHPNDPLVMSAMAGLSEIMFGLGVFEEAQRLQTMLVEYYTESFGPDHPATLRAVLALANTKLSAGDLSARRLFEAVVEAFTRTRGADDPLAMAAAASLAAALTGEGRFDEAEALGKQLLGQAIARFGPSAPRTLEARLGLAATRLARGQPAEAALDFADIEEAQAAVLGADHPDLVKTMGLRATALAASGAFDQAAKTSERQLRAVIAALGREHALAAQTGREVVLYRWKAGDRAGAIAMQRELFNYLSEQFGAADGRTLEAGDQLKAMESKAVE